MYDAFVLCLTSLDLLPPKKKKIFGGLTCVRHNFFFAKRQKFYRDKWPVINNLNGYLYQFFATNGEFSLDYCCDDVFEFSYSKNLPTQNVYPGWYHDEVCEEDRCRTCCKIKVLPEYTDDLEQFLLWLLRRSPLQQIMFLAVGDLWPTPTTPILGMISFKSFIKQITSEGVYSDMCYYICL